MMSDRIWKLNTDSVRNLVEFLPDNRLPYEGNEEFWTEFFNRLNDNGFLEPAAVSSQKTANHPDYQK